MHFKSYLIQRLNIEKQIYFMKDKITQFYKKMEYSDYPNKLNVLDEIRKQRRQQKEQTSFLFFFGSLMFWFLLIFCVCFFFFFFGFTKNLFPKLHCITYMYFLSM